MYFFIVARGQDDLCQYLEREFAIEEGVHVFLDKRSGRDRRVAPGPWSGPDRRRDQRRNRPSLDAQLRSIGYALVRVA